MPIGDASRAPSAPLSWDPHAEIRYRLAYDGPLIGAFLAVFLRAVQVWYRQQARAQGYTDA